jgi:uncharacterized protein
MIITIFGATGMVGKQLIKLALFQGHTVRAYGRNVFDMIADEERHDNLKLVKGGAFDKSDIEKVIKGADVILSALGGAMDGTDNTRSLGMKYIVEAMIKNGVKRIVAIGGEGCLQATDDKLEYEMENFPPALIAVTLEHLQALDHLKASNLDWTFVCPPKIEEAEVTGIYKTNNEFAINSFSINSGDLAQFMLNEAVNKDFIKARVAIGN